MALGSVTADSGGDPALRPLSAGASHPFLVFSRDLPTLTDKTQCRVKAVCLEKAEKQQGQQGYQACTLLLIFN